MPITAEDWSLIKSAFASAVDQPENRRRDFLLAQYGDRPAIVSYVLELLANHREEPCETLSVGPARHPQVFHAGQLVAGRFRIVRLLGEGGMGQVFQVYDEKLSMSIALKTLHPSLARDPGFVQRFRREICVAREVSHPNLCRVFDLVEHLQGEAVVNCLTMELLNGQSLADFIAANRPMDAWKALALLTPISDALASLHSNNIIHRDVKPSNVILVERSGGESRPIVTDFGLAKSSAAQFSMFESHGSMPVGSPYFMAPELFIGKKPGVASDVYALGLILDEMVTHSPAFDSTSLALLYHCKAEGLATPPRQRSHGLPSHWQDAILRCLAPNPDDRYPSCLEFISDLENAAIRRGATSQGPRHSVAPTVTVDSDQSVYTIAVMPFSDLSPDKSQAYLCDGFAEELIHLLSQIRSVRVVARASVFGLRNSRMKIQKIGQRLKATHVICGSVRKMQDRLRVSVQLVQADKEFNLWSEQFNGQMTDIFAIQEEIAKATIAQVKGKLDAPVQIFEMRPPTSNMDSHHFYLQGLFEFNRQTAASLEQAINLFARATNADRGFALAYGALADCYCTQEWYGVIPAGEVMPKAREFAARAIQIDPSLAGAHCALGLISARYEWDWENAAREFKQALALGPGMARPYFAYALDYLTPVGRLDEALGYIRIALEHDPLSPILHSALGGCLYRMRSYELSVRSLQNAVKIKQIRKFYHLHWSLARSLEQLGRYEDAVKEYGRAIEGNRDNRLIYAELGHCLGRMGKRDQAEAVLADLRELAEKEYVSPLCRAFVHLGLSNTPQCLEALEAAAHQRVGALIWISIDPRLDVLTGNPRSRQLRKDMRISLPNQAIVAAET